MGSPMNMYERQQIFRSARDECFIRAPGKWLTQVQCRSIFAAWAIGRGFEPRDIRLPLAEFAWILGEGGYAYDRGSNRVWDILPVWILPR